MRIMPPIKRSETMTPAAFMSRRARLLGPGPREKPDVGARAPLPPPPVCPSTTSAHASRHPSRVRAAHREGFFLQPAGPAAVDADQGALDVGAVGARQEPRPAADL